MTIDELNDWLDAHLPPDALEARWVTIPIKDMPQATAQKLAAYFAYQEYERLQAQKTMWRDASPEVKAHMVRAKVNGADL